MSCSNAICMMRRSNTSLCAASFQAEENRVSFEFEGSVSECAAPFEVPRQKYLEFVVARFVAVFLPLRRAHEAERSCQEKFALIYERTGSMWPFCNSGRVFAVRNLIGTCASLPQAPTAKGRTASRRLDRRRPSSRIQLRASVLPHRRRD